MTEPMTPARLQLFRDWVDGKWPDGSKHVPDGSESSTAELVREIERLLTELKWKIEIRDIYCIATTELGRRAGGYRETLRMIRSIDGHPEDFEGDVMLLIRDRHPELFEETK